VMVVVALTAAEIGLAASVVVETAETVVNPTEMVVDGTLVTAAVRAPVGSTLGAAAVISLTGAAAVASTLVEELSWTGVVAVASTLVAASVAHQPAMRVLARCCESVHPDGAIATDRPCQRW